MCLLVSKKELVLPTVSVGIVNVLSFNKRTLEKHIRQCLEIERASTDLFKTALKTTYGINRRNKLVDFPAFDFIQQTPQDIMHIILEGFAPMEFKYV